MAVAKVLLRGWKETRRSRDESKVKPRRETGLEGRYPEYLTTCVPGRSSESNKKPTKIYRYIYVYDEYAHIIILNMIKNQKFFLFRAKKNVESKL